MSIWKTLRGVITEVGDAAKKEAVGQLAKALGDAITTPLGFTIPGVGLLAKEFSGPLYTVVSSKANQEYLKWKWTAERRSDIEEERLALLNRLQESRGKPEDEETEKMWERLRQLDEQEEKLNQGDFESPGDSGFCREPTLLPPDGTSEDGDFPHGLVASEDGIYPDDELDVFEKWRDDEARGLVPGVNIGRRREDGTFFEEDIEEGQLDPDEDEEADNGEEDEEPDEEEQDDEDPDEEDDDEDDELVDDEGEDDEPDNEEQDDWDLDGDQEEDDDVRDLDDEQDEEDGEEDDWQLDDDEDEADKDNDWELDEDDEEESLADEHERDGGFERDWDDGGGDDYEEVERDDGGGWGGGSDDGGNWGDTADDE